MKRHLLVASASLLLLIVQAAAAQEGHGAAGEKCEGPVYRSGEVTRSAILTSKPAPGFTDEARKNSVGGNVKLSAVLCRTGRVTDIEIVSGLPHGMSEATVEAARRIKFSLAEKDGQAASQRVTIEYHFNPDAGGVGPHGKCVESPALCAGRLVEDVQVEGNRRMSDEGVLRLTRTRAGERFDEEQVGRDLQTLLGLGLFDTRETRVTTLDGVRGGIVVVFTVKELPVIRDLTFPGLKSVSEADVLKALRESAAGIGKEDAFDISKVKTAERVIKELLARRGRPNASVQVNIEVVSSQSVALEFRIDEGPKVTPPQQKLLRSPRRKLLQTPQVARASQTGVEIDRRVIKIVRK